MLEPAGGRVQEQAIDFTLQKIIHALPTSKSRVGSLKSQQSLSSHQRNTSKSLLPSSRLVRALSKSSIASCSTAPASSNGSDGHSPWKALRKAIRMSGSTQPLVHDLQSSASTHSQNLNGAGV
jgi:hypothetical protein